MTEAYANALVAQFGQLIPELVLALAACVLFMGGAFAPNVRRSAWGGIAVLSLVLALIALCVRPAYLVAPGVPFVFDSLALFTRFLAVASGLVLVALSWNEVPERHVSDYFACLVVIVLGTGLVGAANDLVGMFIALELVSIPTYVLLYLPRHDDAAQEAAVKYFLLSILSSAFVLFGFSYLYGLTGTTNITGILTELTRAQHADSGNLDQFSTSRNVAGMALVALVMVVAGLGFRITAVPFHFYAPDVYQGTSAGAAALLAMVPKIAGFAALIRVLGYVAADADAVDFGLALSLQVPVLLWFLAVITMSVGNLFAILQDNLRRLLAYSSVAHAGYMLVALASAPYLPADAPGGVTGLLYYLVAYGAMTVGVFTVLAIYDQPDRPVETIDDLAGFSRSHPCTAFCLTILLFSLIGIPFTAGFQGKFTIFIGAMAVPGEAAWLYRALALVGMVNAAVGAWYYLRIVSAMYLRSAVKPVTVAAPPAGLTALVACVVLTVGLSIPPGVGWLLGAARRSATAPLGPAAHARLHE